ncbi:MAG TPA: TIM-barrel domain-containing protein [Polyangiaceae bacterium]
MKLERFSAAGAVGRPIRQERGFSVAVGSEQLRVELVRADLARLSVSRAGRFDETPTFAAASAPPPRVEFELAESHSEITLQTAALRLRVARPELAIAAERSDGTSILESARDERGRSLAYVVLNDAFALARRRAPNDALFGLGQRTGRFERSGRRFLMWNVDVLAPGVLRTNRLDVPDPDEHGSSTSFDPYYSSTPFFQHARRRAGAARSDAAGFFFDNGWPGEFDFRDGETLFVRFSGGAYTEYVFAGPELSSILEAYTFVTGRPALPPLWSLGHHQCRWHDYTAEELLAVGERYRALGVPCDALWLDIGHMDGHRVFTFHPERFPDPVTTFAELATRGFRTVTIVDPGVKLEEGFSVFDEGKKRNVFSKTRSGTLYEGVVWPGRTAFPDFVQERGRAFWSELVAKHAALGVSGVWNDMNEPATGPVEPFAMRFDRDGANDPHERWHNQYALLMALATRDGLEKARPGERPFVLTRAAFAGIQRLAAQWLGDASSNFEHLRMGVAMALGMGISGQPFVGGDVPGFAGVAGPELASRWFSYAALTPFCRCHHEMGSGDHYPWSFGAEVLATARSALELRYRLLPYLYGAFHAASATGAPVQRPLVFDFQDDERVASIDDEYLLGDALLVAPVLDAGSTSRSVYLPAGAFVDWHSKAFRRGGAEIVVPAPLGVCPMFVAAGAVIPMLAEAPQTTMNAAPELLELHVFVPAENGRRTSLLYEDDGISHAFAAGAYVRTELELERTFGRVTLAARVTGSGFPEHCRRRFRVVFANAAPHSVRVNGVPVPGAGGGFVFANAREPFELVAEL